VNTPGPHGLQRRGFRAWPYAARSSWRSRCVPEKFNFVKSGGRQREKDAALPVCCSHSQEHSRLCVATLSQGLCGSRLEPAEILGMCCDKMRQEASHSTAFSSLSLLIYIENFVKPRSKVPRIISPCEKSATYVLPRIRRMYYCGSAGIAVLS